MTLQLSRCKTLDASADGYVRGEACLAAHLQPSADDEHAHSNVPLVLLCGSATNQDGRSSALTAPNGPAQQAVILAALNASAIDAELVAGTNLDTYQISANRLYVGVRIHRGPG